MISLWRGQEEKSKDEGTCKELLYPEQPAISVAEQERAKTSTVSPTARTRPGNNAETEKPTTASMCARTALGW